MSDWPIALRALTGIYMVLGFFYFFVMLFVLHTYETKTGRRPTFITFWPFDRELREEYPDATRWARYVFVFGLALLPLWLLYT